MIDQSQRHEMRAMISRISGVGGGGADAVAQGGRGVRSTAGALRGRVQGA